MLPRQVPSLINTKPTATTMVVLVPLEDQLKGRRERRNESESLTTQALCWAWSLTSAQNVTLLWPQICPCPFSGARYPSRGNTKFFSALLPSSIPSSQPLLCSQIQALRSPPYAPHRHRACCLCCSPAWAADVWQGC